MRQSLEGKVALVTGSVRRVGLAVALELADCGAHILLHYHRSGEAEARDALRAIKSRGVDAIAVKADLTAPGEIDALFEALTAHYGRLDIAVNSASVFQQRALLDVSLADWELTMALNLRAPFLITQKAARLMKANAIPGGVIINIGDAGMDGPWTKYPHHGISKSALWMLTQVSALELAPAIRVNAIAAGPVLKTDRRDITDEDWKRVAERLPLKRTGTPADLARAVAYLCQEDYITGALLHVNAGEHLT